MHVTEPGSRILDRTRELLRGVADLRTIATDETPAGELRLGAGTNALTGLVPDILARLVVLHPKLKVFIRPGYSPELYRAVESGDLDAAVVLEAPFPLPKTCGWELLREEDLVVLAPRKWAGRDPHELLRSEPLVRYDRTQWGGRVADQYLQRAGIEPQERFELNALNAIAVMVDRGLGVSLVPDWLRPWPEGPGCGVPATAAAQRAAPHRRRVVARHGAAPPRHGLPARGAGGGGRALSAARRRGGIGTQQILGPEHT